MRSAWRFLLLLLITSPLTALSQEQAQPACEGSEKECAAKALKGHVVTRVDFWRDALVKPILDRMGAAPPELVEYLNLDNIKNGIPNKPRAAKLTPDFRRDVHNAIAEIPFEVRQILSRKLAGIYFVEDLGGTGYTDEIVDGGATAVAGFIVLDMSVLAKQTANAWATWKENTPFKAQPGIRLVAEIERKQQNNRMNAIQYILLHEMGHVISINEKFHPSWKLDAREIPPSGDYPWFQASWDVSPDDNRFVTHYDRAFPQRVDVVYYLGAKLPADQMIAAYDNLEQTNFATLYSVTTPADDFAEAFASYVHTVLMKKPFEIRIYRDDKLAKLYKSCWEEKRCLQKRRMLERLIN
jgi:hypothetical protein